MLSVLRAQPILLWRPPHREASCRTSSSPKHRRRLGRASPVPNLPSALTASPSCCPDAVVFLRVPSHAEPSSIHPAVPFCFDGKKKKK
ncbi:hypothetical protein M0R45_035685 [Rubus argutus]|uniref:Uncharacterized protein n=1 Tax=Rubus argutus TaxID=59490 RepID=A0AAW1VVL7_RUBAR